MYSAVLSLFAEAPAIKPMPPDDTSQQGGHFQAGKEDVSMTS